jgi:hypothetical protein
MLNYPCGPIKDQYIGNSSNELLITESPNRRISIHKEYNAYKQTIGGFNAVVLNFGSTFGQTSDKFWTKLVTEKRISEDA